MLILCLLSTAPALADGTGGYTPPRGWYAGVQGGVAFAKSTLSSFGSSHTHAGFSGGVYGGYRFNPVLSLEGQAAFGRSVMSLQGQCECLDYWLGADGNRYSAPVLGMDGADYGNIKSATSFQRYGLQLNVNMLGLFASTRQSRWRVELSPRLAAVSTKATVSTLDRGTDVYKARTSWHLGAGGNLQASYAVSRSVDIGVFTGLTYLTGARIDGLPKSGHKANYLWESGLRIGIALGKADRSGGATPVHTQPAPVQETGSSNAATAGAEAGQAATASNGTPATPADTVAAAGSAAPAHPDEAAGKVDISVSGKPAHAAPAFPTIYFAFNSTALRPSETAKLKTILGILNADPGMKITITGWCDTLGSRSVNARYSQRRAEAVKQWLVRHGVSASRISATGRGSDYGQPDRAKARRAELSAIKEKEDAQ